VVKLEYKLYCLLCAKVNFLGLHEENYFNQNALRFAGRC